MKIPLTRDESRLRLREGRREWASSRDMTRMEFIALREKRKMEEKKKREEDEKRRKEAEANARKARGASKEAGRAEIKKGHKGKILIILLIIAAAAYAYLHYVRKMI